MAQLEIHPEFKSRPWCMEIINSPFTKTIPWPSRPAEAPFDHPCSFFAQTLHTAAGIPAAHALWQADPAKKNTGEALLLVAMGDGMNYYSKTLHGGMVAALLDEAIGLLILQKMGWKTAIGSDTYTVKIEISLKGKVETPGVCVVRAWADDEEVERQGKKWTEMRKLRGQAAIEDRDGRVLVEGKYMFIRPSAPRM